MDRIKNKVALITGAASGLGKETALLLAKEGAKVIITDIDEVSGEKVAEEVREKGGGAIFIRHDVASENDWILVMKRVLAEYGRLDVLVNNAGVIYHKRIEEISLEKWRWVMSINLDGVFLGTKYAIGVMKNNGGGSIINISSAGGIVGTIDTSAYNASKGAVRLFTKASALECSKAGYNYNIRVNSVHPGVIMTPMIEDDIKEQTEKLGENEDEVRRELQDWHPMGRIGEPIDIAYGILYLASDESKFVTGSELVIDGGWTAR